MKRLSCRMLVGLCFVLCVSPAGAAEVKTMHETSRSNEIKQTESRIQKEREAAAVNLAGSSAAAGAAFGMGAAGSGAGASASSAAGKEGESVDSQADETQAQLDQSRRDFAASMKILRENDARKRRLLKKTRS